MSMHSCVHPCRACAMTISGSCFACPVLMFVFADTAGADMSSPSPQTTLPLEEGAGLDPIALPLVHVTQASTAALLPPVYAGECSQHQQALDGRRDTQSEPSTPHMHSTPTSAIPGLLSDLTLHDSPAHTTKRRPNSMDETSPTSPRTPTTIARFRSDSGSAVKATNITAVEHRVSRHSRTLAIEKSRPFRGCTIWFTGLPKP